ncbi:MAG: hypothetical protein KQJ78_17525 [Deltaproteobacteria bacterium]|nr:hypothetical protein [Deltaproteobacteria bacterium]
MAALALALVLVLGACQPVYQDAGPNPARVRVTFHARLTEAELEDAILIQSGPVFIKPGRFDEFSPPWWRMRLFLVDDEGSYTPLAPEGPTPPTVEGLQFDQSTVFLAPPGERRLRLLVECIIYRYYNNGSLTPVREPINALVQKRDYLLKLAPGQEVSLGPLYYPLP